MSSEILVITNSPITIFACILGLEMYLFNLHYGGNTIYSLGLGKDFLFSAGLMVCVCTCVRVVVY